MASRGVQLARGEQPIGNRNDIYRLVTINQERDLTKDGTVLGPVKIPRIHQLCNGIPTLGRQQNTANNGSFSFNRLGLHADARNIRILRFKRLHELTFSVTHQTDANGDARPQGHGSDYLDRTG